MEKQGELDSCFESLRQRWCEENGKLRSGGLSSRPQPSGLLQHERALIRSWPGGLLGPCRQKETCRVQALSHLPLKPIHSLFFWSLS